MRNLEKGQHIFIAFQNGKAVLDSQLRPRIYTSLENADKWTPTVDKGKIEYVEYAPTLTPPNEWVSVEDRLPEVGQEVLIYWQNTSQKAEHFELTHYDGDHWFLLDNTERPWIVVVAWMPLPAPPDRRPPEGEEDT